MRVFEEIKNTVETGLGKYPCDIKISNVQLVNVYSGEIYPTDIYIKGERIVSIDPNAGLEAKEVVDGKGQFAAPGLIDSHMHFETTMLSPEALSSVTVPKGTLTLCADLMEIANVAGEQGLRAMLISMNRLPCRIVLEVPSRVPTAPGLETTGAILGAEEVKEIMAWDESVSLGEMDPSKILLVKDEYLHKIADTIAKGKVCNGHAIGRMGQELNVYASSGISDDHECVDEEEMIARLRVGMNVFIREGSTERNLDELICGALRSGCCLDNISFCTDDKHPNEIRQEGHINYNVKRAIELGCPPIEAIKMATINAAKHFHLEGEIGSITPGRIADILLIDKLEDMQPDRVFFKGKLVAQHGALLRECEISTYPDWIKDTVHLKSPITAASFAANSTKECGMTTCRVIQMIDRQIINTCVYEEMPVRDYVIGNRVEDDILKLAVVERYGKTGTVGIGFVRGFNLKRGALAFSTSHDHHNIVCVGCNDENMAVAVNEIARLHGGGAVANNGTIIDSMPLVLGGLMSDQPAETVMKEIDRLNDSARSLGNQMDAPFMALSFISLPTVPELGLTDKGLIDVLKHEIIPLEISDC